MPENNRACKCLTKKHSEVFLISGGIKTPKAFSKQTSYTSAVPTTVFTTSIQVNPSRDLQTSPSARKQAPRTHLPTFFFETIWVPEPFHGRGVGSDPADFRPNGVQRRRPPTQRQTSGPCLLPLTCCSLQRPGTGVQSVWDACRRHRETPPRGPPVPQRRALPGLAGAATRLNHPALHVKSPLSAGHAGKAELQAVAPGPTVGGVTFPSWDLPTRRKEDGLTLAPPG